MDATGHCMSGTSHSMPLNGSYEDVIYLLL